MDDDEEALTPERWSWVWLAGWAVNAAASATKLAGFCLDEVAVSVFRHDMWRGEQRRFHESITSDLESIPVVHD